jgi:hypothetical protein
MSGTVKGITGIISFLYSALRLQCKNQKLSDGEIVKNRLSTGSA